jgi:acylphosphatase
VWIRRHAIKYGLKGLTFFKNDGSIKIIAEGEERNLLIFIKKLKRGRHFFSIFFSVENFSIVWHEPRNEFVDFSISESKE